MEESFILDALLFAPVFLNITLVIVFAVSINLLSKQGLLYTNDSELLNIILVISLILFMGLRPISYAFGDMGSYYKHYINYANGGSIKSKGDALWHIFMQTSALTIQAKLFFLLDAFLYIYTLYLASKRWVGNNWFYLFLGLVTSFSFWAYGVNGIRNGIATSLFIYGLSRDKAVTKYLIFFIAYNIHGSILIPFAAFFLTQYFKNPKFYFYGWLAAIPLSLVMGGFWENFFMGLGFDDDRAAGYLSDHSFDHQFSSTGFRWDFVLYSASAVYAGYYFVIKRGFQDKVYHQILNIYLTANAFWILVIRASFSNRFAYLSWFMMAVVIFYPFLKQKFFEDQQQRLAFVLLAYFGFTYLMNFI